MKSKRPLIEWKTFVQFCRRFNKNINFYTLISRAIHGIGVRLYRALKIISRSSKFRFAYLILSKLLLSLRKFNQEFELLIATPKSGLYVAIWLKDCLGHLPAKIKIVDKIRFRDIMKPTVVISPQKFFWLPHNYVAFQVEQLQENRHWNELARASLTHSFRIFEYSAPNLPTLYSSMPREKIELVQVTPLRMLRRSNKGFRDRTIDVLFYGSLESERRQEAIRYLAKNFRVEVVTSTYLEELGTLIADAKCVANIHFWDDSLFESIRISEVLSYATPVISEEGSGQGEYPYTSLVTMTAKSDWLSMSKEISKLIHSEAFWNEKHLQIVKALDFLQLNNEDIPKIIRSLLTESAVKKKWRQ
jgi:hypothetical protein